MKNFITTIAVVTVSLVATQSTFGKEYEYNKTTSTAASGYSVPKEATAASLSEKLDSKGDVLAELDYYLTNLDFLQSQLTQLLNQEPSTRDFKSYRDYYRAYTEWLQSVEQLEQRINTVEKEIEYLGLLLDMDS